MRNNVHYFDPSTYDAKTVHKPLSQLMREAELERAHAAAAIAETVWKAVRALFRPAPAAVIAKETPSQAGTPAAKDTRLAA